ncbi:MAG TPA: S41 family peptidase [Thermoanaerobaculia bacterium]|jgi:C-terminal processing protease CtpA/Prc|nr:S41 family peptidase [Thermoanaerobaculia bacterium]
MKLRTRLYLTLVVLGTAVVPAQPPSPAPALTSNLDFEQGQPGEIPPGWHVSSPSSAAGYRAEIVTEQPETGRQAVRLSHAGELKDARGFGNLMTSFDAAPYRGKKVRFRAAVRAEVTGENQAALWLRVDREGGAMGFFDNMADRPITSPQWQRYEIVGEVTADAEKINLGCMLANVGTAWLDSVSFEVLGEAGVGNEPARPLTGRGLENLIAFTRLLGYVRYFHPSDQAAAADWEKLALAGVQAAENAGNPEELARTLEAFFQPVAPALRVFPTAGPRPALPAELMPPKGTADPEATCWKHLGIQVAAPSPVYKSQRISIGSSAAAAGGRVQQYVDAAPFRDQRVRLRVAARAEVPGTAPAEMGLKVYRSDDTVSFSSEGKGQPITASAWRTYELAVDVGADAVLIEISLGLTGEGRVFWDDVTLESAGEANAAKAEIENQGFETAGEESRPAGWRIEWSSRSGGYSAVLSEDRPQSGKRSLLLSYRKPDTSSLPKPGEPLVSDLGGGASALVPLALYRDASGTLPHGGSEVRPPASAKPEGFLPSGNDRTTRLAAVALAWNVFQHFYPYFDVVEADWPAELRRALASAATDPDERAFLATLRGMVAALQDGHGNVYLSSQEAAGQLPLFWEVIEGRLVVTQIGEGAGDLRPGDVVLSLDGRPVEQALSEAEKLVSGATPGWRRWRVVSRLTRGKRGETMRIDARHTDGETFTATLTRSLPTYGEGSLLEARPEKIAEVRPGIFYVDIDRINDADFKGALDRLAAAKGIVFDLRGYPGNLSTIVIAHLIDHPVSSARWTVPVVTRPDRQGWDWEVSNWSVQPREPRLKAKVAFLIDGRAISYAETYMGIIENYRLAAIVGEPTAGTNGNVNPFRLPGGYNVAWTGMRVLKHDGSRHHGIGILPTVPVSRTLKGVAEGRDELLEKAIAVVGSG